MEQNAPVPNQREVPVEEQHRFARPYGPATLTPPPIPPTRPRRRRGSRWLMWLLGLVIGVVVLALLACALVGGLVIGIIFKVANEVSATVTSTQTYTVSGVPGLDIHNTAGRVQIQQGAPGVVSVQITKVARDTSQQAAQADLENIGVNITQIGDQLTLTTNFADEGAFIGSSAVNLLISVPPEANITADVTAGDVQISDINGLMEITAGAGSATLQNVTLGDGSRIQVATGSATVSGAIAHGANVSVAVSTGSVIVQLPSETQARLDARTNIGSITINGWPLEASRLSRVGATANGALGDSPTATIRIRVDSGNITIAQQ
jgi:hypothetical protein